MATPLSRVYMIAGRMLTGHAPQHRSGSDVEVHAPQRRLVGVEEPSFVRLHAKFDPSDSAVRT